MALENVEQFNTELKRSSRLVGAALVARQKRIVMELLRRFVMRTPVDTGYAQNNWQVQIGSPPEGEVTDAAQKDPGATIAEGLQELSSLGQFQLVVIGNNVPYIVPLEEGHSPQAEPGTIVELTLSEVREMFE